MRVSLARSIVLASVCASALVVTGGPASAQRRSLLTEPEQIRIAYGDDPCTSMRIVWQTQVATRQRLVRFGTNQKLEQLESGIRPSYPWETGAIAEATLRGLRPDTRYFYQVGDPDGGWSAVRSFRTAPRKVKEFHFTAFGDHGVTQEAAANVRNILNENPAFHLILGDVSYANGNQPIWDQYLRQIEPLAGSIPFMLTLGNHENERLPARDGFRQRIGYASYLARFAMPGVETWYSFDYGPARFVAFNSDDGTNPAQLEWLKSTLRDARGNPSIRWIIVFQHHPLYGTSRNRGDNPELIRTVGPIYDTYSVDLVLEGHDHHYERQFPIRAGKATTREYRNYTQGVGTLYVVQGGGGKSLYEFKPEVPDVLALRDKSNGYLSVKVTNDALQVDAKRINGTLIESFAIRRK